MSYKLAFSASKLNHLTVMKMQREVLFIDKVARSLKFK